MNFSVKPVEAADLPALGRLNTDSKLALSINKLLWKVWPNEEAQYKNCYNAVEGSFNNPAHTLLKVVDNSTGQVLGSLIYVRNRPDPKAAKEDESKPKEPLAVPDDFNPEVFTSVVTSVEKLNKEHAHLDHFQIIFTIVDPSFRRQGVGSLLLNELKSRARAEGIPIATQTEPLGYEFFKAHGFKDTSHADWDLSVWATPMSGFGMFRLAGIIWYP